MKISRKPWHSTLYMKPARGPMRQWRVWVEGCIIYTEHGEVGGKLQESSGLKCDFTNVGQSNERTPEQQALAEAEAMWVHRVERKYRETPEEAAEQVYLPMLAQDYWVRKHGLRTPSSAARRLQWPVLVQPKLNGVRCIARWVGGDDKTDPQLVLTSRGGKEWHIPHVEKEVRVILPRGWAFDGELYIHGMPLQDITSLARAYRPASVQLKYCIYDLIDEEPVTPQHTRCAQLAHILDVPDDWSINLVATSTCDDEDELEKMHRNCVKEGYEGIMLRAKNGVYAWGARSANLLKYKSFQDAEFKVKDVVEGKGKFEGCAIFVCRNNIDRGKFQVSPKVDHATKQQMWRDREKYIGRLYTVRFFDRYKDGLPQFPIGIAFRDEGDLP